MTNGSWATVTARAVGLFALVFALGDCSDSAQLITHPTGGDAQKLRDGVVLSGPLGSAPGVSTSGPGSQSTSALTYASMPPGTLTDGDSVRIANTNISNAVVIAPMGDGGFDPVPIAASENDSLDVGVFRHGQAGEPVLLRVPAMRQPAVIRTTPGRGRTDVPLNQAIVIVLSQPLDASTVTTTSVLLTLNGVPVPAAVQLQVGQPWVVLLTPTGILAPNATYTIVVTTAVKDANGSALPAQVSSTFTTSATVAAVASVSVRANNSVTGRSENVALASVGGSARFVAQNLSAAGDTLQYETGQNMQWKSSDEHVATVAVDGFYRQIGVVLAVSEGSAMISACLGSACGQAQITVRTIASDVAPVLMADLGGGESRVWDMKGAWVTGTSFTSAGGCEHAFLWSAATGAEDLGTLPGECSSFSVAVSEGPVVIGFGDFLDSQHYSLWIWTRVGGIQPLSPPTDGVEHWFLYGIDGRGNIAFGSDSNRTAIRDASGNVRIPDLPTGWVPAGGMNDFSQMTIITDGETICDSQNSCGSQCGTIAYVWDFSSNRTVSTLEPRDPSTNAPLGVCPWQINNSGIVSGLVFTPLHSATDPYQERAFRWSAQRGFEYAPPPAPGVSTEGYQLNEAGDMTVYLLSYLHVGSDSVYDVSSAVWMADGRMIRLGSLGGDHTAANGINDAHIVVGHSQVGSNTGEQHAVLWDLSTATQSQVAPSVPLARSTRNVMTDPRGAPPEQAWRRSTIRHWSRTPRP
jgi:Bacterial Ig-like domain/Bacterial Ig-like domain (group 2)